ncbi:hypothetical protein C8R45DRAFT_939753 [Mycena sanguinolenta]|nr:hypothetical protein C8R45DRAFT_939753 [Mycena sanguinolenta]
MLVRLEALIISFIAVANAYIWASPQLDALEAARFVQQGFNGNLLPCEPSSSAPTLGELIFAADWIRTTVQEDWMLPSVLQRNKHGQSQPLRFNGGSEIAFRDAAVPDAPGVPEPQQDLASHIASFARLGFTQTEMIGLVACHWPPAPYPSLCARHTFGGVQPTFSTTSSRIL